jgi:hypothetical protein
MILFYFEGFLVGVGAGIGERFAFYDTDGIAIGIEGIEPVFEEGDLAAGEID